MSEAAFFTARDAVAIRENPSAEAKIGIARRIGLHFRHLPRQSAAYRVALEIALMLQKDQREDVRAALAESVAAEAKTPAALAAMLANDLADKVAVPVLLHSPRLTDALLIPIIHATQAAVRLMAVAARARLSSPACLALIEKQFSEVCRAVLEKHEQILDEPCYRMIVRHYAGDVRIMQLTRESAQRARIRLAPTTIPVRAETRAPRPANDMPARIPLGRGDLAEGLYGWRMMMERCQQGLALHEDAASPWPGQTAGEHDSEGAHDKWQSLVQRMNREGALQAPVMLMALSMGLVPLFALCLARHAQADAGAVMAACTNNEADFRQLYQHSHLPSALYRLCWWALAAAREQLARGMQPCSDEMRSAMARKLAQAEGLKINFARTIGQPVMEALLRTE